MSQHSLTRQHFSSGPHELSAVARNNGSSVRHLFRPTLCTRKIPYRRNARSSTNCLQCLDPRVNYNLTRLTIKLD